LDPNTPITPVLKNKGKLSFQQESCKAIQVLLDAARGQCTSKFRVFVIGKYDELSYTDKTVETSNGYILQQTVLEPLNS
jgi:hypothetical protein